MRTVTILRTILHILVAGMLFGLTCFGPAQADWRADLERLRTTEDPDQAAHLTERIVKADPPWQEVVRELESATFAPAGRTGEAFLDSIPCRDGEVRPYVVYLPSVYEPARPTPLLVYLHGGVSRTELPDDPLGYANQNPYLALAEERGWAMIYPMGQGGATWWDKVGVENVLAQVRRMKTRYNIDDDRVWMTGFSDGGSGSFGFAMLRPSSFAAFVPLNGHMGVANLAGELPTFPRNLQNSALHVINTDRDGLYPASKMRRTIEMANDAGASLRYREYHGIGHELAYAEEELPRIAAFLERHPRDPFPPRIVWESADRDFGRCHWLQIASVLPQDRAAWHTSVNSVLTDDRITIGFQADDGFEGEGVRVASLADGESLARDMGLQADDVIVRGGDDVSIKSLEDLNEFKATLSRGDHVELTVLRDGERTPLTGQLPEAGTYYLFEESDPSAAARAAFMANRLTVETSRLGTLVFWVHPDMVQLSQELVIEINGKERFRGTIEPDLAFLLRNYLEERDRQLLYVAQIRIDLSRV